MKKFLLTIFFVYNIRSEYSNPLDDPLYHLKQELEDSVYEEKQLDDLTMQLTISSFKEEIQRLHQNIEECIEEQFEAKPSEILPFNKILLLCTGEDKEIVVRFYQEKTSQLIEITTERIKNKLAEGYCDDMMFRCVYFFQVLEMLMTLNYDVTKSLNRNKPILSRKVGQENTNYLVELVDGEIGDYETVRQMLKRQESALRYFFDNQKNKYQQRYNLSKS